MSLWLIDWLSQCAVTGKTQPNIEKLNRNLVVETKHIGGPEYGKQYVEHNTIISHNLSIFLYFPNEAFIDY